MKLFKWLIIVLISFNAFSQDLKQSEVPVMVRKGFKTKYPNVYVYEWEWKKKKQVYEAEFMMSGKKHEAYFIKTGKWLKTERDVKKVEVPEKVWKSLSKTPYSDWEINDIEEHSTPKYNLVYELELKTSRPTKRKTYLYFLPDGKLIENYKKH